MRDLRRGTIVLTVGLIMVLVAGMAGAQTSPPRSPGALTPDDLLAVLDWKVLQELAGGPQWWPHFPQFNVGIGDRAPGLRFYVVQSLTRVGGPQPERLETTALLYERPSAASGDFAGRLLTQNDKGMSEVRGPSVGDASRYFTRSGSGDLRYETTLRFTAGPFVSRVSIVSATDGTSAGQAARVARLREIGAAIERRLRSLQDGRLRAAPIPARIAEMLPPRSVTDRVGPLYGTAVLPPHAWALADTSGDPQGMLAALQRGGVDDLTLRRYGLRANPTHVVEVTYMFFATPEHAAQWVSAFIAEAKRRPALERGKTGGTSAFTRYPDGEYELQFAKGQAVGDVFCLAPFGTTTSVCEQAVRDLAEGWYAALPGPR